MDRNNMFRVPVSPSSIIRKIATDNFNVGKLAAGRPAAENPTMKKPAADKNAAKGLATDKPMMEKSAGIYANSSFNDNDGEPQISQARLQDAIIWSEILGKPVSKRGKRRTSWQ